MVLRMQDWQHKIPDIVVKIPLIKDDDKKEMRYTPETVQKVKVILLDRYYTNPGRRWSPPKHGHLELPITVDARSCPVYLLSENARVPLMPSEEIENIFDCISWLRI
jgi:hypothetical protein